MKGRLGRLMPVEGATRAPLIVREPHRLQLQPANATGRIVSFKCSRNDGRVERQNDQVRWALMLRSPVVIFRRKVVNSHADGRSCPPKSRHSLFHVIRHNRFHGCRCHRHTLVSGRRFGPIPPSPRFLPRPDACRAYRGSGTQTRLPRC